MSQALSLWITEAFEGARSRIRSASYHWTACRLNTAPELPNNRQYRLVLSRIAPLLMPCFVPLGLPGVWDDWGRVVVDRVCGHVAGVRRECVREMLAERLRWQQGRDERKAAECMNRTAPHLGGTRTTTGAPGRT